VKEWVNLAPSFCSRCKNKIKKIFFYANTEDGWSYLCQRCFTFLKASIGEDKGMRVEQDVKTTKWRIDNGPSSSSKNKLSE
jgi:hypothetical protein